MLEYIFYLLIVLVITYVVVYYLSGLYFSLKKYLQKRRDIKFFETEIERMENMLRSREGSQQLDSQEREHIKDKLERYKEALSDIRQNG